MVEGVERLITAVQRRATSTAPLAAAAWWVFASGAAAQVPDVGGAAGGPDQTPAPAATGYAAPGTADGGTSPFEGGEQPRFVVLPRIGTSFTLTDNATGGASTIGLAGTGTNTGARRGDLIARASPGVAINKDGGRTHLTLDYAANFDKYVDNSNLDGLRNALTARGDAELLRQMLFVESTASVSQQLIDQRGPIAATDRFVQGNTSEVTSVLLSPYLRNAFGPWAQSEVRYNLGVTDSGGGVSSATRNDFSVRLNSGPEFNRFIWAVSGDVSETSSGNNTATPTGLTVPGASGNLSRKTFLVSPSYVLQREVTLTGGIGWEQTKSSSLTTNPVGIIWNFGVQLTPGPRTVLKLAYNERFGSNFVSVDGSYEIDERSKLTISYNESIQTQQDQRLNTLQNLGTTPTGGFIDRTTGLPFSVLNPGQGVNNGFGDTAFRDRQGRAAITLQRDRNTYNGQLFFDERTGEQTATKQTNYSASTGATRELSPYSRAELLLSYLLTKDTALTSRTDDTYRTTASYSYDLSTTLHGTLAYSFLYRHSTVPGGSTRENALVLSLNKTF